MNDLSWLTTLSQPFILRGLVAAFILGPLLAAMGTLVIAKRMVFFSQTLGHAAMTGVAVGLLLGEQPGNTFFGVYGFCSLAAVLMLYLRRRDGAEGEVSVGIVLSQVLGLGIVLLVVVTQRFDVHQVEGILFGSLITLTANDLWLISVIALLAIIYLSTCYNRVLLSCISPSLAKLRYPHSFRSEYLFVFVLSFLIVSSIKLAGALLVLVLIVAPPASARQITTSVAAYFWLSMIFGWLSASGGIVISVWQNIPIGGAIVLVASLTFYACMIAKVVRRKRPLLGKPNVSL